MKEAAANGAREDKYMACTRFRKGGGRRKGGKGAIRGRGGEEGTQEEGIVLEDDEGTQRRKLNGEGRERERAWMNETDRRKELADGTGPRPNMIIEYGERCEHSTL